MRAAEDVDMVQGDAVAGVDTEQPRAHAWTRLAPQTGIGDDGMQDDVPPASGDVLFPFRTLYAWLTAINLWGLLTGGLRAVFAGGPTRDGLRVSVVGRAAISEGDRLANLGKLSIDAQKPQFSPDCVLEGEWAADFWPTPFRKLDSDPEVPSHRGVLVLVGTYPGYLHRSRSLSLVALSLSPSRSLPLSVSLLPSPADIHTHVTL